MDIKFTLHQLIISIAHAYNRDMTLDMVGVVGSNPIAPTRIFPWLATAWRFIWKQGVLVRLSCILQNLEF